MTLFFLVDLINLLAMQVKDDPKKTHFESSQQFSRRAGPIMSVLKMQLSPGLTQRPLLTSSGGITYIVELC